MRFLVTGAGGQLGSDLLDLLPGAIGLTREQLSVADRDAVREAVSGFDVVLNCAADNAVDAAEAAPERAFAVNAEGPANLAWACREAGARLVHFSTNFVFDGSGSEPFTEEDEPRPMGAYGRSKLEGERRVREQMPDALVVRSSGLFGWRGSAVKGGSFPERILKRARAGEPVRVVDDQLLNPTYTADLAAGVLDLIPQDVRGVIHLVAGGCCSYWEMAAEVTRLAGLSVPVEPISSKALDAAAPRPANGCLSSLRVRSLRPWQEGLAAWWEAWSVPGAVRRP
ncbi:MAG: dTDP-4-dehydrorhamnose reductase [Candidatus Nephthysia bennettiae]|uniref:dTDP-4-dehydrorhamnose reductase n=1 Tax=Candidatus Nephthysia bennettiae TaxID=3127016 RepID=A0A934K5Z1_9BACT|nr:dTDP-4-dehydrorhamnose reductase [Candidatus Dormibacteraeota bacterium]MBJ7613622.1 dTDP-4-dehydrorhamnose reductase [Candidatus Dormibacteraeota bacterium]PZS00133.1 MAG: dTDP-4-dehydrorhamnose reductase [Candidatus Dormibacteraeota bacterium]